SARISRSMFRAGLFALFTLSSSPLRSAFMVDLQKVGVDVAGIAGEAAKGTVRDASFWTHHTSVLVAYALGLRLHRNVQGGSLVLMAGRAADDAVFQRVAVLHGGWEWVVVELLLPALEWRIAALTCL